MNKKIVKNNEIEISQLLILEPPVKNRSKHRNEAGKSKIACETEPEAGKHRGHPRNRGGRGRSEIRRKGYGTAGVRGGAHARL